MGVVYEATDHEQRVRVALKTLRTWSAEALLRFKNEFRALQDIHHPNLVALGELHERDGEWFFTMELVHGKHLLNYVRSGAVTLSHPRSTPSVSREAPTSGGAPKRTQPSPQVETTGRGGPHGRGPLETTARGVTNGRGPLEVESRPGDVSEDASDTAPVATTRGGSVARLDAPAPFDDARVRSTLAQIVRGLNALHRTGRVHRDVKPSNVMVTAEGQVKILDFGLVLDVYDIAGESDVVGTIAYMAPEQTLSGQLSPAADWYSLGVILYEALTGHLPFEGSRDAVLSWKRMVEPTPPSALRVGIPEDLASLCVDLLRLDPDARPGAREIARRLGLGPSDLDDDLGELGESAPVTFVGREKELSVLLAGFEGIPRSPLWSAASRASARPLSCKSSRRGSWLRAR
jgi:serine/threonine protein kinase